MSVRAMATRWFIPPLSWCGNLCASFAGSRPDFADPLARPLATFLLGHVRALEAEGDIFEHRAVGKVRIVLEDKSAVRPGLGDRRAMHKHGSRGGREMRRQPRDQAQHRALAAAAGPEDADELADPRRVLDRERDIPDRRELAPRPKLKCLGHLVKVDDARDVPRRAPVTVLELAAPARWLTAQASAFFRWGRGGAAAAMIPRSMPHAMRLMMIRQR